MCVRVCLSGWVGGWVWGERERERERERESYLSPRPSQLWRLLPFPVRTPPPEIPWVLRHLRCAWPCRLPQLRHCPARCLWAPSRLRAAIPPAPATSGSRTSPAARVRPEAGSISKFPPIVAPRARAREKLRSTLLPVLRSEIGIDVDAGAELLWRIDGLFKHGESTTGYQR